MAAPAGIRGSLAARLRRWALRRQGHDALPVKLSARRVYIVPTRAGWMFGMLLAVMFVAGMNYGNGLALLFTFWLAGFALVAMVQTQRGLAGATLREASAMPAHAGADVRVQLQVESRHDAGDLLLAAEGCDADPVTMQAGSAYADGVPGILTLEVRAERRGHWRAPPLRLGSVAPFGLFRTWTWLQLDIGTVIYPALAGPRRVPEQQGDGSGTASRAPGHDELAWLREFRHGDSPRQVAWKAYARGQPLLVREYQGEAASRWDFDFDALAGLHTEQRLSQLARWIVDAHARNESWVLRLPGAAPMSGSGDVHRLRCLERLALFPPAGGAS